MSFELVSSLYRRPPEKVPSRNASKWLALGSVGVAAATLALDRAVPYFSSRQAELEATLVENVNETSDQVVYTLPGCRNNGEVIASMLESRFESIGDTSYAVYPEKGFSLESLKERLLESRRNNIDKPASFYAISMGGLVLSRLLADDSFRAEFGEIDKIVFDSSPASLDDVRVPTRRALNAAGWVGDSWLVHSAYRGYMRRQARGVDYVGADVTAEQARQLRASSARTSLSATVAQGEFIQESDIRGQELVDVANEIYYVRSEHDDVIDTDSAYEVYSQVYKDVGEVVDTSRHHGSHASGVVYQRVISEILAGH